MSLAGQSVKRQGGESDSSKRRYISYMRRFEKTDRKTLYVRKVLRGKQA